ncbi:MULTISPECIES: trehalose-phosphatase [unclassified Roseitalea]|uniref:trehalose-phosphatase n=1 Tax=unclassified Roseitalea TaxID=2639107 RepID=UPI00273F4F5B|nr:MULTISPECIES: trehalose-phosphatase [unclassified Roseitalea]
MDKSAGQGDGIAAVIFDMDGVVTDTAQAHFAAWKRVFDEVLQARGADAAFTHGDYLAHVDGIPRYDGVRRFLRSRGIEVPEGGDDDEHLESVRGIGNRKNRSFRNWLEKNRVPVFDDAVELIHALKKAGIGVGVFSASRNAPRVLESAGIAQLFDVTVSGADAQERDLSPKPAPDQLEETARRLGCAPARAAVVEDAVAGVRAGAAGRFGLVIGVDRQDDAGQHRHALRSNGADLVTDDLRRLCLPEGGGLRTLDRLPLVRDRLDAVRDRLGSGPTSVFLDYDGTLSPIVADYRDATIPEETRTAVARLAERCPVAVISGRDLADVRARVGLDEVIYAGSHGFDIAGPDGLEERPDAAEGFVRPIEQADAQLRDALSGIEGADVERKTFSVAVHYRRAADSDVAAIEDAVDRIVGRHDKLRRSRGKKVFEIQPRADWDKGRAVQWLLAHTRLGESDALPIYLGDDLTDEDAFSALGSAGLCIAVRGDTRATLADYALADPQDVRRFVEWLAGLDMGEPWTRGI